MLTYNPSHDGGTFEESKEPCKLTFWQLKKMADSCLWAERMYIDLEMYEEATRYARIWSRIFRAMASPDKFFGK